MAEKCDEEGSEPRGIETTACGRHQPSVRRCFGQPSSTIIVWEVEEQNGVDFSLLHFPAV